MILCLWTKFFFFSWSLGGNTYFMKMFLHGNFSEILVQSSLVKLIIKFVATLALCSWTTAMAWITQERSKKLSLCGGVCVPMCHSVHVGLRGLALHTFAPESPAPYLVRITFWPISWASEKEFWVDCSWVTQDGGKEGESLGLETGAELLKPGEGSGTWLWSGKIECRIDFWKL